MAFAALRTGAGASSSSSSSPSASSASTGGSMRSRSAHSPSWACGVARPSRAGAAEGAAVAGGRRCRALPLSNACMILPSESRRALSSSPWRGRCFARPRSSTEVRPRCQPAQIVAAIAKAVSVAHAEQHHRCDQGTKPCSGRCRNIPAPRNNASPVTPPSPVGSGQGSGFGRQASKNPAAQRKAGNPPTTAGADISFSSRYPDAPKTAIRGQRPAASETIAAARPRASASSGRRRWPPARRAEHVATSHWWRGSRTGPAPTRWPVRSR